MTYAPSAPLVKWRTTRRDAINTLAAAHAAMGEVEGRGRPLEIGRPVGNMYVLRVVAEFQGFVRDLHDLAAERLVSLAKPQMQYQPLLIEAITGGRHVDHRNADIRSIVGDFQRLGVAGLRAKLAQHNKRWDVKTGRSDKARYQDLIQLRNALAHGNQGEVDKLRARGVVDTVTWARSGLPGLDRTARALDRITWDHLVSTFGAEPW